MAKKKRTTSKSKLGVPTNKKLYESKKSYSLMSRKRNLYGNGYAYKAIVRKLDKII